jgi:natural product precursor
MRTKKTTKKLVLNKNTISDLNKLEQSSVKGGTASIYTCFTCYYCETIPCAPQTKYPILCSRSPECKHVTLPPD